MDNTIGMDMWLGTQIQNCAPRASMVLELSLRVDILQ